MNETILIIDDTPEIIRMIRTVLQDASYKTLIAREGIKGLAIAKSSAPDLILLDIMMPGSNGYEICKLLKLDPLTEDIPVIFISALDNSFDKVTAFASGGADYVPKPIQEDELLARIRAQLDPSAFRKELKKLNADLLNANNDLQKALSELKLSQQRLIESEKLASIGVLSAGIAHEINNPLHFIAGNIDNLKEAFQSISKIIAFWENKKNELNTGSINELENLKNELFFDDVFTDFPKIIDDINSGADRIVQITKGLGLFLHSGPEVKQESDIHDIIDTALLLLSGKHKNFATIEKNYDQNSQLVLCFPGLLNQVFVNIINNALDALHHDGKIIITTQFLNDNIIISVKDNGKGISPEILSRVFDPFFTTKDVGKGTGLGLYISYEIIKKHEGSISVKSQPSEFTEFTITLPKNQN